MNPTVAILSIGNEVLRGCVVNTNAAFLGRELTGAGFEVVSHGVCADTSEAIRFRLGEALRRADVVLMMGGLGPTPDDVTREGIAAHYKVPLIFSKSQFNRLKKIYKRFGKRVPALVRREALYPANAQPLINRFGIALGFSIKTGNKLAIALPGVPAELQNMYFDVVLPLLRKHYPKRARSQQLVVKLTGIGETDVMKKLGKDFFDDAFDFGIYPMPGEVAIRIMVQDKAVLRRVKQKIATRLADRLYAWEDVPLAAVIGKILTRKKRTLAVAESCTGGLLVAEITKHSGASRFLKGATITYHGSVKQELGVSARTLKHHGEVSRQVAAELARAVKDRMEASYGIGITGIAGPGGGSKKKPVGLVYIGIASPDGKTQVWKHVFWGERNQVQIKAAVKALEYLWRTIR